MAEIQTFYLSHKEVVEALIKHQNIHEGIWQIIVEFGIGAANIGTGPDDIFPSAIVPVKRIGLNKVDKMTPLSVDASEVNPK